MKLHKLYLAFGFVIAFFLFFELAAHADVMNQRTIITVSAPVQIPGKVLPAGSYIFEQADPNGDQNTVAVYSADHKVSYGILHTIPADRMEPTGDTVITLAEPASGNPILVKWFYPGLLTGHEFIYGKRQEQEIAQAKQQTFVGNQAMPNATPVGEAAGE